MGIKRGRYLKTIIGDNLDNSTMLNFCACSLLVVLVLILYLVFILLKYLVVRHFKVGEKHNLILGLCNFSYFQHSKLILAKITESSSKTIKTDVIDVCGVSVLLLARTELIFFQLLRWEYRAWKYVGMSRLLFYITYILS